MAQRKLLSTWSDSSRRWTNKNFSLSHRSKHWELIELLTNWQLYTLDEVSRAGTKSIERIKTLPFSVVREKCIYDFLSRRQTCVRKRFIVDENCAIWVGWLVGLMSSFGTVKILTKSKVSRRVEKMLWLLTITLYISKGTPIKLSSMQ